MKDKTRNILSWFLAILQIIIIGFSAYIILPFLFKTDASIIGNVILLPFTFISVPIGVVISIIMLTLAKKHNHKILLILYIIFIILYLILISIFIYLLIGGNINS